MNSMNLNYLENNFTESSYLLFLSDIINQNFNIFQEKLLLSNYENQSIKTLIENFSANLVKEKSSPILQNKNINKMQKNSSEKIDKNKDVNNISDNSGNIPIDKYCDINSSSFNKTNKINLKRSKHKTKNLSISCKFPGCKKNFNNEKNLQKHNKICQYKENHYKCPYKECLKSFPLLGNLRKHLFSHQEKKEYKCNSENCGEILTSVKKLKIHELTHKNKDIKWDKDMNCKIEGCDYKTKINNKMEFHLENIHKIKNTGRKIYCPHGDCDIGFKSKGKLLSHHDYNDEDCKSENILLIKLIGEYKKKIGNFVEKNDISENILLDSLNKKMKEFYKDSENSLIDEDLFKFILEDDSL